MAEKVNEIEKIQSLDKDKNWMIFHDMSNYPIVVSEVLKHFGSSFVVEPIEGTLKNLDVNIDKDNQNVSTFKKLRQFENV